MAPRHRFMTATISQLGKGNAQSRSKRRRTGKRLPLSDWNLVSSHANINPPWSRIDGPVFQRPFRQMRQQCLPKARAKPIHHDELGASIFRKASQSGRRHFGYRAVMHFKQRLFGTGVLGFNLIRREVLLNQKAKVGYDRGRLNAVGRFHVIEVFIGAIAHLAEPKAVVVCRGDPNQPRFGEGVQNFV